MKCFSCRIGDAASYKKILLGHRLFETLKNLNPGRFYNEKYSYFCDICLDIATKKLETRSELSDQNANSLSVKNASFTANTIESLRDEYDLLVAPQIVSSKSNSQPIQPTRRVGTEIKRKATSGSSKFQDEPCPKRFKKRFRKNFNTSSIRENDRPESVRHLSSSQNIEAVNSESLSVNDVLLNIQRDNADSVSSEKKAASRASVKSSRKVATVDQVQASGIIEAVPETWSSTPNEPANVINDGEEVVEALAQIDSRQNSCMISESNLLLSTLQSNLLIAGPSAPAVKNPRLRNDLMGYFVQNAAQLNVNNYSRFTAG